MSIWKLWIDLGKPYVERRSSVCNGEDIHVYCFSSYLSLQREGEHFVFNCPQLSSIQLPKSIPEFLGVPRRNFGWDERKCSACGDGFLIANPSSWHYNGVEARARPRLM